MTTLHWHRWRTRQGLTFILQAEPWNGNESTRLLGDEFCTISRNYDGRWAYRIFRGAAGVYADGQTGSPTRSRRIAESIIDRNRVKLFGAGAPDIDSPLAFTEAQNS